LYRQQESSELRMPLLGAAIRNLSLGTVDARDLARQNGEIEFLESLLEEEMTTDIPDAFIFVGSKYPLDRNVSPGLISLLSHVNVPIFYLVYMADPLSYPWRDGIGEFVRKMRGVEYTISRPRDLHRAWSDIITRVERSKSASYAETLK
jgi:hypothetical protein